MKFENSLNRGLDPPLLTVWAFTLFNHQYRINMKRPRGIIIQNTLNRNIFLQYFAFPGNPLM